MATVKQFNVDGTLVNIRDSRALVTGVKGSAESTYRTGNVNLSKTNVGLGNVPNVTTNNQTPTFSQASTRDNLVSGDKLSVLFSKIMKWFADLKTVAFSGSYNDLSDKPTIPTVNNATLTIQKNGTNVQTFTANASSNKTANITVPTKTSQLTNDSSFINENILNITSSTVVATLSDSQTYTVPATGYYRLYGKIPPVYDTNSHQIGFLLNDIYCVYYFLGDVPEFFQFEIPLILKKGTVIKFACDVSGSTGTINKLF